MDSDLTLTRKFLSKRTVLYSSILTYLRACMRVFARTGRRAGKNPYPDGQGFWQPLQARITPTARITGWFWRVGV